METPLINRAEIYLANFPFGDSPGMKLRPVLTLTGPLGTVPEVLVAYISSVVPPSLLATDLVLDPTAPGNVNVKLRTTSVLRLHKLATIHARNLVRRLGRLSADTEIEVGQKLRQLLSI